MTNQSECPTEDCRYFPNCETTRHHLYYPKNEYNTGLEKRFRNLACHVIPMCMQEHQTLHMTENPPIKPDIATMRQVINEQKR